ncbi:MAG: winged helix-turn-helix domain-containing protein [Gemmataceae bacterium]
MLTAVEAHLVRVHDGLWRARRVADLIRCRPCVSFHPNYLREWLTASGFSPEKPALVAH